MHWEKGEPQYTGKLPNGVFSGTIWLLDSRNVQVKPLDCTWLLVTAGPVFHLSLIEKCWVFLREYCIIAAGATCETQICTGWTRACVPMGSVKTCVFECTIMCTAAVLVTAIPDITSLLHPSLPGEGLVPMLLQLLVFLFVEACVSPAKF